MRGVGFLLSAAGLSEEGWGAFQDAGGEDYPGAAVVEGDGEGKDAPTGAWAGVRREEEEAAAGTVNVSLAGLGDVAQDFHPVDGGGGNFDEQVAAGVPLAGLAQVLGGGLVAVDPVAGGVEDLHEDVGADGERDSGVEEVARVDDDR